MLFAVNTPNSMISNLTLTSPIFYTTSWDGVTSGLSCAMPGQAMNLSSLFVPTSDRG